MLSQGDQIIFTLLFMHLFSGSYLLNNVYIKRDKRFANNLALIKFFFMDDQILVAGK